MFFLKVVAEAELAALFLVWVGSIDDGAAAVVSVDWLVLVGFVFYHENNLSLTLLVFEAPILNKAP